MKPINKLAASGFLAASTFCAPASAEDWEFLGSIYLWGAGVDGTTASGAEIDIGFDDILDNLEFALLGSLEASRGKFFALADVVYLDQGAGSASTRPLLPALPGGGFTINGATEVDVQSTVLNFVAGYELVEQNGFNLQGFAGARYLNLDSELNLAISVGPLRRSVIIRPDGDFFDGVIGVRGRIDIAENWFVPYYFDIGAGESDFTWQAFSGVGYSFGRSEVTVGYRHTEWDFGSSAQIDNIAFSGLGVRYAYRF